MHCIIVAEQCIFITWNVIGSGADKSSQMQKQNIKNRTAKTDLVKIELTLTD